MKECNSSKQVKNDEGNEKITATIHRVEEFFFVEWEKYFYHLFTRFMRNEITFSKPEQFEVNIYLKANRIRHR